MVTEFKVGDLVVVKPQGYEYGFKFGNTNIKDRLMTSGLSVKIERIQKAFRDGHDRIYVENPFNDTFTSFTPQELIHAITIVNHDILEEE